MLRPSQGTTSESGEIPAGHALQNYDQPWLAAVTSNQKVALPGRIVAGGMLERN